MPAFLLANIVHEFVLAAKPIAPDVLPGPAEIDTQLTNAPANWATLLIRVLDTYIDPLFTNIPTTAVSGTPGGAAVAWNTEAQIHKVMTAPTSVVFALPVTNTLPLSKADVLDYKLRSFQRAGDILKALDIYLSYIGSGRSLPPPLTATKNAAKGAIRDLVVLEAFLVRYAATINAAATAGISLAETLALYRVEGDLAAPLSNVHILDRLPVNEKINIENLGDDTHSVSLTLQRGLWSYPFKALAPRALGLPAGTLPVGAARAAAEQQAKCFALIHWMILIGGLDLISNAVSLPISPLGFRALITTVMQNWRMARGLSSIKKHREDEFDRVMLDLKCIWPADANGRLIVVPDTPVLLATFALTQAVLLFGLDHTKANGPFIQPHPDLTYLAYNLQHARSNADKTRDRYIHLLASAAVAAAKSTNPTFAPLKAKLAPLGLPNKLQKDPKVDSSEHVSVFDKLTAIPTKFLDDATNSGLLADFILRAEHKDWNPYEPNRGNLARYRKLLEFYRGLLS